MSAQLVKSTCHQDQPTCALQWTEPKKPWLARRMQVRIGFCTLLVCIHIYVYSYIISVNLQNMYKRHQSLLWVVIHYLSLIEILRWHHFFLQVPMAMYVRVFFSASLYTNLFRCPYLWYFQEEVWGWILGRLWRSQGSSRDSRLCCRTRRSSRGFRKLEPSNRLSVNRNRGLTCNQWRRFLWVKKFPPME